MRIKSLSGGGALLLALTSQSAFADGASLAHISKNLLVGGHILTKLMWAACIVVGIALIAAAFTQFQIHRRNPKLVPLTTPVLYLILGIVAIAIPFVPQFRGFLSPGQPGLRGTQTAPPADPTRTQYTTTNTNDIDAPLY